MKKILLPAKDGTEIPLSRLADINYVRGPQVIKSEDTFLTAYVLFDMKPGRAEVNVVENAQRYLTESIDSGEFVLPPGVSYAFAGSYENQIRSQKTLRVVLPLALFVIFIILYFQFRSVITTSLVFSGIVIAWAGGFIMLWLYGQPWFLDFNVFGAQHADALPDPSDQLERGHLGRLPGSVRDCVRRRCGHCHLPRPDFFLRRISTYDEALQSDSCRRNALRFAHA